MGARVRRPGRRRFIEYRRATDRGLVNQGWKDSFDGINDAAGRLANPPIALCEVQAYHYAALRARADLAEGLGDTATAGRLREEAESFRDKFSQRFWLPDRGYYAVALDGEKRVVDALTSNVGHCLWAGIATDEHATSIIERLADSTMDTGFGLRTLASDMGAYNPMSYHNGSVWPHDTAIAVAGLLRYRHLPGAVELAERLANGIIDAAAAFGGRLPELYCGFPRTQFPTRCRIRRRVHRRRGRVPRRCCWCAASWDYSWTCPTGGSPSHRVCPATGVGSR